MKMFTIIFKCEINARHMRVISVKRVLKYKIIIKY